jgi:hypothetical protein
MDRSADAHGSIQIHDEPEATQMRNGAGPPEEEQMRRVIVGTCMALSLAMVGVAPAGAATTTVQGTGSYEQLVVKNGAQKLVFKIHAPGGDCDIRYLMVRLRDRDGTRYSMEAGCYFGEWAANVVRGEALVECPAFTLTYNETESMWTGAIPRTCLRGLAGSVKVTESYVDDYSPNLNEVPATSYVAQG